MPRGLEGVFGCHKHVKLSIIGQHWHRKLPSLPTIQNMNGNGWKSLFVWICRQDRDLRVSRCRQTPRISMASWGRAWQRQKEEKMARWLVINKISLNEEPPNKAPKQAPKLVPERLSKHLWGRLPGELRCSTLNFYFGNDEDGQIWWCCTHIKSTLNLGHLFSSSWVQKNTWLWRTEPLTFE